MNQLSRFIEPNNCPNSFNIKLEEPSERPQQIVLISLPLLNLLITHELLHELLKSKKAALIRDSLLHYFFISKKSLI